MRGKYERFAPLGLYLSLAAAVAALVIYILQRSFALPLQICLGLIILGLAASVLLAPRKAKEFFTGRQARYGSNVLVSFLAILGIVVVLNVLANNNSKRWDITADKEHSLAPETLDILSKLSSPVKAQAFYTANMSSETASTLLESFKYNSNGKFTYQFINPDTDPVTAQQAGITRDGTVVLVMDGRSEQLTYIDEQALSSALVRLSNPGQRVIYFTTGHGEFDTALSDDTGLSSLKTALEAKNYTVKTVNLLTTPSIPSDALTVIVPGYQKGFSDAEIAALKAYQDTGGSLVVWSTPPLLQQLNGSTDLLAGYLNQTWGLVLGNNLVVDLNVNPPSVAYGASYGDHAITSKLGTMATLFPRAQSVTAPTTPADVTTTLLISTSQNSWAETDMASIQNNQVSPDQNSDLLGPVPLAYAGTNNTNNARIVVIGNAEFATNSVISKYGNLDLAVNSIDWAARQDNLINLTPKATTTRSLITPTNTMINLLLLGSVIVLPGSILVAGIIVWIKRRKRG